ncbi:hypothetical protein [Legionella maceachernii]|nr:hypothetical protein [Legionella maceachernii]
MGLLPRVGRSFAFAQDDGGIVVPNVVRDLPPFCSDEGGGFFLFTL